MLALSQVDMMRRLAVDKIKGRRPIDALKNPPIQGVVFVDRRWPSVPVGVGQLLCCQSVEFVIGECGDPILGFITKDDLEIFRNILRKRRKPEGGPE